VSPVLRIVAVLLLVREPLLFAAAALQVWPTLLYRGPLAVLELAAHGIIAAVCVAAAMMLLNQAPDGRRMARVAVTLSVVRAVSSLYWSALPSSVVPGHEPVYAAISIAAGAILLFCLKRPSEQPFR
jgi:uncharacterized protein YbjT (DUF2867 family)